MKRIIIKNIRSWVSLINYALVLLLIFLLIPTNGLYAQKKKSKKKEKRESLKLEKQENGLVDSIEYFQPQVLNLKNHVYKSSIKTVNLHVLGNELADPIIQLNGQDLLLLRFDELGDEINTYSYTIQHCTHDWKLSDIDPFDYMASFTRDDIMDYEYSFNTSQSYTHYQLILPNNQIQFTKSGNYLLKVYANDDPEDLVLTRRFVVYEKRVSISSGLFTSPLNDFFESHQRINFKIDYRGLEVQNPLLDIRVNVLQNGRWDNSLNLLKPVFIRDKELIYDHQKKGLFEGGNEFRYFDFRSLRQHSERVYDIATDEDSNEHHVQLAIDQPRDHKRWKIRAFVADMNGKFQINRFERGINHIDADYAWVHFNLKIDEVVDKGNIYLFGGLTDWSIQPKYQMRYNPKTELYEGEAYLKQGYYDYQYVIMEDNRSSPNATELEGNYYNTENDYYILVYWKLPSSRYDRVIGFRHINTMKF